MERLAGFGSIGAAQRGTLQAESRDSFDGTIDRMHGGYSSAAERLTVAQDVVGSIPTSRPKSAWAPGKPLHSFPAICRFQ